MRVCVGAGGPFHIFDLARQLERMGDLTRLYTGYPRSRVVNLPRERVSSHPARMMLALAAARYASKPLYDRANLAAIVDFDEWMAESLEPCDVLHTLSSFGTKTQKAAKKRYGALRVCDRGSSHILYQDEVLRDEFDIWKLPYTPIDPQIIERELEEYEVSERIVVPSEYALKSFLDRGVPAGKVRQALLGVDLRMFHPAPREDRIFRVLYVGALSLQKGIPYLLEAFAGLRMPDTELCLIGAIMPEIRPFLAKYEGRFRHLGTVSRSKLFRQYSQASVLVLPSLQDGMGMVQAQAMACGTPVIASTNTGAANLFTDGKEGFIVPIRDVEALRDRLLRLYRAPELQQEMSVRALERVKHLGGWNSYGDRVAEIYREALEEFRGEAAPPAEAAAITVRSLPPLRVSVSVGGKFHAFHLAEQLAKRRWLQQFLTTYFNPKTNAWGVDVPRRLVRTNFFPELVSRVPDFMFGPGRGHWSFRKGEYFDRWAASQLKPCDVFIGWSGFSSHTVERAREMGATTILVRGSAHILTQKKLLDEEGERFGVIRSEVDPWMVEKEMKEYELVDFIAMPSRFCERTFCEQGLPPEKLLVWPLGADVRRFRPSDAPKPDGIFRVLAVGEVGIQKGIYYLVEAFRKLNLPNSELLLVGVVRPSLKKFLQRQPPNIRTTGVVRYPALQKVFHSATVVAAPSIQDGFNQVVLQALASGIPVIVSENAGVSEAIHEGVNGLVVPPRDVDSLAAAIERCYRDKGLIDRMAKNAHTSALRFTWNDYGTEVEKTMLKIAEKRAQCS